MAKVMRIEAVRRLAAWRARHEVRATAGRLIEAHGPHVGYTIGLAERLPETPAERRTELAALAEAIEREVGFGWYFHDPDRTGWLAQGEEHGSRF